MAKTGKDEQAEGLHIIVPSNQTPNIPTFPSAEAAVRSLKDPAMAQSGILPGTPGNESYTVYKLVAVGRQNYSLNPTEQFTAFEEGSPMSVSGDGSRVADDPNKDAMENFHRLGGNEGSGEKTTESPAPKKSSSASGASKTGSQSTTTSKSGKSGKSGSKKGSAAGSTEGSSKGKGVFGKAKSAAKKLVGK